MKSHWKQNFLVCSLKSKSIVGISIEKIIANIGKYSFVFSLSHRYSVNISNGNHIYECL